MSSAALHLAHSVTPTAARHPSGTNVVPFLKPALREVRLPRLSGALSELMAMSEEERMDFRRLEALVAKDPVALTRLLALTNSVSMGLKRRAGTIREALMLMGAQRVCDTLFIAWTLGCLEPDPALSQTTELLVKHTLSMAATVRRVVLYAGLADEVDRHALTLVTLVNRLSLALSLSPQTDSQEKALMRTVLANQTGLLSQIDEFSTLFERAPLVGQSWGLPRKALDTLAQIGDSESLSWEAGALQLAEAGLHQRVHPEQDILPLLPEAAQRVLSRLTERNACLESTVMLF